MRPPTDHIRSLSDQAGEKADATTDLTTSERPIHEYVEEVSERTDVRVGVPLPLGTYARGDGVNFAVFSRHASRVRLELFDHPDDARAARVMELDPTRHRTGDVWHVWVKGIRPGQLYAYRVDSPYQPMDGHRFNFHKLLLDPSPRRSGSCPHGSSARLEETIRLCPGKIRYVRQSMMPAPCRNAYSRRSNSNQPLRNYWGCDPVVFCAPKSSYCSARGMGQQKLEFREMVQVFHNAEIEVFLDVVFNHTAEGDELGPTLCFRGMDNAIFYMLADDKRSFTP